MSKRVDFKHVEHHAAAKIASCSSGESAIQTSRASTGNDFQVGLVPIRSSIVST